LNFTHRDIPEAVAYAKEKYYTDGVKRFLYYCADLECYGRDDNIHVGRGKLSGKLRRRLNVELVNFYTHWETYGQGKRKKDFVGLRTRRRRARVLKQLPYLRWEDDGGPSMGRTE
jgi:hypothetical protein